MKRLIEWLVGLSIIGGLAGTATLRSNQFYGSWGAEPTPEVLAAWEAYRASVEMASPGRVSRNYELVRASAPIAVFDEAYGHSVRAFKAEYLKTSEHETHPAPLRQTIVIAFDGRKIVRSFYVGRGPKEYREAF